MEKERERAVQKREGGRGRELELERERARAVDGRKRFIEPYLRMCKLRLKLLGDLDFLTRIS